MLANTIAFCPATWIVRPASVLGLGPNSSSSRYATSSAAKPAKTQANRSGKSSLRNITTAYSNVASGKSRKAHLVNAMCVLRKRSAGVIATPTRQSPATAPSREPAVAIRRIVSLAVNWR